jgi:hypothetical protein
MRLLAGCQGCATVDTAEVEGANEVPVELALSEFEYLAVNCEIEGIGVPCLSDNLTDIGQGMSCIQRSGRRISELYIKQFQAFLAGVPLEWCTFAATAPQRLLFRDRRAGPSTEQLQCKAIFPGYERTWEGFQWMSLRDGFQVQHLILKQSASGWGKLEVTVTGLDLDELASISSALSALDLVLEPVTGGQRLRYGLVGIAAEGRTIDCVPTGSYRWWIEPTYTVATLLPRVPHNAVVNVKGTVRLPVELADTGGVEVRLVDGAGGSHTGAAVLRISREGSAKGAVAFVSFSRAPYRILGLPPGAYGIAADTPPMLGDSLSFVAATVVEGKRELIDIPIIVK